MANGNRNALGAIGGLTQGLFRGVTTGIGLQQRQQALDREKLESELGLFNHIAKLPHGSFKKAAMGRFLPRLGFTQDTTDLLTKANEEDQEYLNRALTNIIEQLPQDMGFSGFKELVGRMTPEQIINLVGVGLQIEGIKSQRAGQKAIQGALGGQAGTEQPQPQPREGAVPAANALATNLRAQRDQLTVLMASPGIGAPQKEAIKTRISSINRDIERIEGMSPTQFSQQLQLSRERGAAAADVKREQPLGGEATNYIDPNTLRAAHPAMTENQAIAGGLVKVTPKQKESLDELGPVANVIDTLTAYSDRLITARTAPEAIAQGARLTAGAIAKSNALAAAYNDSKEAFTGIISRSLGGEKGVLTDRDIKRISNLLPNFRDTVAIKELKNTFFRTALESAIQQKKNVITGQLDPAQARKEGAAKIDAMFKRLDAVEKRTKKTEDESVDLEFLKKQAQ